MYQLPTTSMARSTQPSPVASNGEVQVPTAPIAEQSITASLTAEIMHDLDNGQPTLVAYTEGNAGDLREVSPARLRDMAAAARAQLDQIERLANTFEAEDTIGAILTEHNLTLEEVDPTTITECFGPYAASVRCWAGRENGRLTVWAPAGQDPIERVNALADLVNDPNSVVREG